MKLIVGLGNPGKKYAKTRHNIGFRVIDSLDFARDKDVILLKPDNFMNNSGRAVQSLITKYKIQTTDVIVVHDDIDLLFGDVRVSKDSSSAGHKGVQSIIDALGAQDFIRIRIGIRPQHEIDTTEFVLKNFTKTEEKQLPEIIKKAIDEIDAFLTSCS
jgi:PTH1 family peptidyl-tRNA hydrolase